MITTKKDLDEAVARYVDDLRNELATAKHLVNLLDRQGDVVDAPGKPGDGQAFGLGFHLNQSQQECCRLAS